MSSKRRFDHQKDVVFLSLGGTSEIGMNCYCYGVGSSEDRQWLIVDIGVKFADMNDPGIDLILPDLSFLIKNRESLCGLILTHAHEDHLGAVAWLWPQLRCPIYCTPFAAAILKHKLIEAGLEEEVALNIKPVGSQFELGPFKIEMIAVNHSTLESTALFIETEQIRLVHTGDWKIDRTPLLGQVIDEKRFREIGALGIDVLVCDSTNVFNEGISPSEQQVAQTLADIVSEAKGRVAITTFASHIERIASSIQAARLNEREVVVVGRAMRNAIEAARSCGYLKKSGELLDEENCGYLPPNRVLLLCTGSQGEPRAAIARIAEDQHPHIALDPGDLVIFSSRTIPGNEREVLTVINNLAELDIDILTAEDRLVHSSGHPRRGELKMLYDWLKPNALIPMHGEPRHLRAHAKFAKQAGIEKTFIPHDGCLIRLNPGPVAEIDEVISGRLHVDGRLIVSEKDSPARQRRKLSYGGIVIVSLVLDAQGVFSDGELVVLCDGIPAGLEKDLKEEALQLLALRGTEKRQKRNNEISEYLRQGLRRAADRLWGKKPIVKVISHQKYR